MPIQECACFTPLDLQRPGGVLFDAPCRSAETDRKTWTKIQENIRPLISSGNSEEKWVMCMIQTRSTRKWDKKAGSFTFKASEDYLIAAYLGEPSALVNYKPGTVLQLWLRQQISFTKVIGDLNQHAQKFNAKAKEVKANQFWGMQEGVNNPLFTKVWQANSAATNLTVCGALTLLHRKLTPQSTQTDALSGTLADVADGEKYGWRQHKTKKKFGFF